MRNMKAVVGLVAATTISLAAASSGAVETYVKIETAVEDRAASAISIAEARQEMERLTDPLHKCYWERQDDQANLLGRLGVESRWRVTSTGSSAEAQPLESPHSAVVTEKNVRRCFQRVFSQARLDPGAIRVVLTFYPMSREFRQVRVKQVRITSEAKPDPTYLAAVRDHVSVERTLLCSGPGRGSGDYTVPLSANERATYVSAGNRELGSLSCNLGAEAGEFPVHPELKKAEFEIEVRVSEPKPRRPFESHELKHELRALSGDDVLVRTRFSDAEVWTEEGMVSTNYLRSVCRALPAVSAENRFREACTMAPCACKTEYLPENWGDRCQPYIDAGRPDRDSFIEGMFRASLQLHRQRLAQCGERCTTHLNAFRAECGSWLGEDE